MSSLQNRAEPYAPFQRENAYMCHTTTKLMRAQSLESHAHFMPMLVFLSPPVRYLCADGAGMGVAGTIKRNYISSTGICCSWYVSMYFFLITECFPLELLRFGQALMIPFLSSGTSV